MNSRFLCTTALLIVLVGGLILNSVAQEPAASNASATKGLQLPGPGDQPAQEIRFEVSPHAFGVNGVLQEVYIKLDTFTGKTWRFHASTTRWTPIAEPTSTQYPLQASEESRYELHTHDYYDTTGEEQEMIMRVDLVNGHTWTYRGANGTWKDVPQDE